jgi:hypothetical protein
LSKFLPTSSVTSDGRVQTKAEFVDALVDGKSVFKSISLTGQTVSIVGDIAILRHRFEADAVSNGTPSRPRIKILQVWQKQDGVWYRQVGQRGCLLLSPPDPSRRKVGIADKRKRWAISFCRPFCQGNIWATPLAGPAGADTQVER